MQNLNLALISGGYHHCTPEWNEDPNGRGKCFKLYFPVEGSARIFVKGEWFDLEAGKAYFINGFFLEKQRCDHFMNIYWVHFIPESPFLSLHMNNLKPVYSWEQASPILASIDFTMIPLLFESSRLLDSNPMERPSLALNCHLNASILLLVSNMMTLQASDPHDISYDLYLKLNPALEYMNLHYMDELKIEEISQQVFLNPIYFSRLFKKCFKMTPARYLNTIRLNEACRLLTQTDLSLFKISESTGFCNQFHFSKMFKQHFCKTPSEYRVTRFLP